MFLSYLISELPPLKKHQYHHVQDDINDDKKKDQNTSPDHDQTFKSEFNEHKPNLEIMKVEKHEEDITPSEANTFDYSYKPFHHRNSDKIKKAISNYQNQNECIQPLYQPLTPPSPKTSNTAYASKLLQQLQIHRSNVSEKIHNSRELFNNGNNPLSQLAEISLAAAAAAHSSSTQTSKHLDGDVNSSLTKQNIIANLMFPTLLQHIQQRQQHESNHAIESAASVPSVPTPSNTPSPPPAHVSPYSSQSNNTAIASQHSALMEILSKPPLKPNPPVAHTKLPPSSGSRVTFDVPEYHDQGKTNSSVVANGNPYGSISRLQLYNERTLNALPPPQTAPEDLSITKIARKLNFKESYDENYTHEKLNSLTREHLLPQPQQLFLNNVLTTTLPLSSSDRNSVESRSSSGSCSGHHECQDCGKVYSTSSNLARHRQTHR